MYLKTFLRNNRHFNIFQEMTSAVADIPLACPLTYTICMFSGAFQPHYRVISRADSLICYAGYQTAPSGWLYAVMDQRHLGCHRQVVMYTSLLGSQTLWLLQFLSFFLCRAPARSEGGWGWQVDVQQSLKLHRLQVIWSLPSVCMCVFLWLAIPVGQYLTEP